MRISVKFTPEDEAAILESVALVDEEVAWRRRGICREYIENKVGELLRSLRAWAAAGCPDEPEDEAASSRILADHAASLRAALVVAVDLAERHYPDDRRLGACYAALDATKGASS